MERKSDLYILHVCRHFFCLSIVHLSIFLFPDDNLSKYQWIFTKFGMCIYIVEIWFGIADGQISSNFDSYLPATDSGGSSNVS